MTKHSTHAMDMFTSQGASIEYAVQGRGEPLLLIHGGLIAESWAPLIGSLSARYQVIWYHRRGFRGSAPVRKENTVAAEAADAAALLDHLGLGTVHVAGHSFGAITSLQFAVDHPQYVHSVALLEPALLSVPAGAEFGAGFQAIGKMFADGDTKGALDGFLMAVAGDGAATRLDKTLGTGWYESALEDIAALFVGDLVALGQWQFGSQQLASIAAPALAVVGSNSAPVFHQTHAALMDHLRTAQSFELPNATHLLQMDNPAGMGTRLLEFFATHPMSCLSASRTQYRERCDCQLSWSNEPHQVSARGISPDRRPSLRFLVPRPRKPGPVPGSRPARRARASAVPTMRELRSRRQLGPGCGSLEPTT